MGARSSDDDIAYVLAHPLFRGLAPVRASALYEIRLDDGEGHEMLVRAPLAEVFGIAAGALRRIEARS
jgi:hypothetical protein